MKIAKFKVDVTDVQFKQLFVDARRIDIINNESIASFDDAAVDFVLTWRFHGPTGSKLEIAMTVDGGAKRTILKKTMGASDNEMKASAVLVAL